MVLWWLDVFMELGSWSIGMGVLCKGRMLSFGIIMGKIFWDNTLETTIYENIIQTPEPED